MGLQTEVWLNSIVEGVFSDNTFAARSVDHSEFVNNKTVHVPNAGSPPNVEKNREDLPADVKRRTDIDLTYDIDEFTTDPILITNAESVELSYNKRVSVTQQSRDQLADEVHGSIIYSWVPEGVQTVVTTGTAAPVNISGATGNRKAMTKAEVKRLMTLFNSQKIPKAGRYIMIDSFMYAELLDDLTDAEKVAFLAGADPTTGIIGKYMGFQFYERDVVAKASAAGGLKPWDAAGYTTDSAAGIAWQSGCVSRALGASELFENERDATYYGDIISVLQRAGGRYIRADKKGIALIYQGTPA